LASFFVAVFLAAAALLLELEERRLRDFEERRPFERLRLDRRLLDRDERRFERGFTLGFGFAGAATGAAAGAAAGAVPSAPTCGASSSVESA
jgi:hypothetical protein